MWNWNEHQEIESNAGCKKLKWELNAVNHRKGRVFVSAFAPVRFVGRAEDSAGMRWGQCGRGRRIHDHTSLMRPK